MDWTEAEQAIGSAALLGTERQPFTAPIAPGKLGELLAKLDHSPAAVLQSAAAVSLYRRAGWRPENRSVAIVPCSPEKLPRCSPQATRLLQQMLTGHQAQVLIEWLERAAAVGQRACELCLPDLLNLGRRQDLRSRQGCGAISAILPVLGQRGGWLATQNPDWSYATSVTTDGEWETGSFAARLLYLQQLRLRDADIAPQPLRDRARELLVATWKQEAGSDRAKFLRVFQINLSLADEAVLEDALNDRSREVRRVAADLLASLPDSQLGGRMVQRVAALVGKGVDLSLPTACDAEMQRDGILPKASHAGVPKSHTGERTWWLQQMIGATPMSFWEQKGTIAKLVKSAQSSEWSSLLFTGWRQAVLRQRHAEWAQVLMENTENPADYKMQSLLSVLSPLQKEAFMLQFLQTHNCVGEGYCLDMLLALAQHRQAWSDRLTEAFLTTMKRSLANYTLQYWQFQEVFQAAALCVPPHSSPDAIALREVVNHSPSAEIVHKFLATVQFRQEVLQAFA